ncbi:hypothetical protein, partial [Gordonia sp. (in: high G+C Gram-positive bacteria)]|uniref:hypothetical protein n=1 Tax=Gordonia sp. (in: high G+C Gram-positive bacteria) TaxID=84139 RepID=UPI003C76A615
MTGLLATTVRACLSGLADRYADRTLYANSQLVTLEATPTSALQFTVPGGGVAVVGCGSTVVVSVVVDDGAATDPDP